MGYTPHVVVIGGGSTGTGVARDLAMRGLEVTLVERGTLASGTSGSMHAVLHSGARYAVDDPELAAACRRENRVLREIAAPCVRETGGLFASLPSDPPGYAGEATAACEDAGIETTALDGDGLREREPALSEAAEAGFAVPDAVVDPFLLCAATARSARRYGAEIRTHSEVVDVAVDDGAVESVLVRSRSRGRDYDGASTLTSLDPDHVVNAAGPRAGPVAGLADLDVAVRPSQGAMVVVDRSGLETVVNRCRPRTEGDIAVPFGSTAVLGTTDRKIDGADAVDRDPDAVEFLLDELGALVPPLGEAGPLRAYWGVRALPAAGGSGRQWTLVDHESRDGVWGMTTVFGGKLTTHRLAAEAVADHVCGKFGIDRPCRTADFALPDPVPEVSGTPSPDPELCACEEVRRSVVRAVLDDEELPADDDLRPIVKRTRAGMGACQGGQCGHRLAYELSPGAAEPTVSRELEAFYEERWRGRRHALWGANLAAAAGTYERHESLMSGAAAERASAEPIQWREFDAGPEGAEDA